MREKVDKRTRVLAALAARSGPLAEDQLPRVSHAFLQEMWREGLIDGAGYPDERGVGTRKQTRVWWITEKGRGVLREWEKVQEEGLERMRRHGERYGEKGWDPAAAPVAEPLPRATGHIPEIVVTPTPVPTPATDLDPDPVGNDPTCPRCGGTGWIEPKQDFYPDGSMMTMRPCGCTPLPPLRGW